MGIVKKRNEDDTPVQTGTGREGVAAPKRTKKIEREREGGGYDEKRVGLDRRKKNLTNISK